MNRSHQFLDKAIIAAARRRIQVVSRLKNPRYEFMQNLIDEPSPEEAIQYLCNQINDEQIKESDNDSRRAKTK